MWNFSLWSKVRRVNIKEAIFGRSSYRQNAVHSGKRRPLWERKQGKSRHYGWEKTRRVRLDKDNSFVVENIGRHRFGWVSKHRQIDFLGSGFESASKDRELRVYNFEAFNWVCEICRWIQNDSRWHSGYHLGRASGQRTWAIVFETYLKNQNPFDYVRHHQRPS